MKHIQRLLSLSVSRRTDSARQSRADQSTAGFTIIETLTVLAIAGLILLIVFEAIPALERSSRNNSRRQDVQAILAAVSHYELNNSGNLPGTSASNFLQYSSLSYYDNTVQYNSTPSDGIGVYLSPYGSGTSGLISHGPNTSIETVNIYNYQKCSPTTAGKSVNTAAGYSDIVALYALESSASTSSSECEQL